MKEVETSRPRSGMGDGLAEARTGLFRATLLFGSIAAALSLIVVPAADRHSRQAAVDRPDAIDPVTTGSNRRFDPNHTVGQDHYVMQRSVLQPGTGPCLLFPDGTQRGAC